MSYAASRADALDYDQCRYGASKLVFRGPKKSTDDAYVTILGSTEAFGRCVARPFPELVDATCDLSVVNLGCQNAGIDAFLYDADIMSLAKGAKLNVVQAMGAINMSNRFYRVHPRRNDRFLGPSKALKSLYHEVDFTDFSFNRHMLSTLNMVCSSRFSIVREELRKAWTARMLMLLQTLDGPVLLLWLRETKPRGLGAEPLFVGADMVHDLSKLCLDVVEVPVSRAGTDLDGMIFGPMEVSVASEMLGVNAHKDIAQHLSRALQKHV